MKISVDIEHTTGVDVTEEKALMGTEKEPMTEDACGEKEASGEKEVSGEKEEETDKKEDMKTVAEDSEIEPEEPAEGVMTGLDAASPRVKTLSEMTPEELEFDIKGFDDNRLSDFLLGEKNSSESSRKENVLRIQEVTRIIKKYELAKNGLSPERVRMILEDLGPTFVKMGQIMSKRTDILPKVYCVELEKLCEESKPLPIDEVVAVIEEQFGKPISDLFESFEEKPLGSASIGQVHAAVLKDGRPVVVKVQRPGVEETMRQDIMLLRKLVKPLKLAPSMGEVIDFRALLEELWKVSQQELNYLIEAVSTIKFRELNADQPGITCPIIEETLTTSKVMTMEFIKGCSIGDNEKLDAQGYDRGALGSLMTQNYIKQVLDDGFFHADPHQGNIMVRDEEIVWIDMGMMGSLTVQERNTIKQGIHAIVKKDNQGMIRALISLGAAKGDLNYSKLYTDIDLLMDRYYTMDLGEMNMGTMLEDIIRAMNENNIVLPASISMLARGLITIEGVLSRLSPETNIIQIAQTYVKQDMRKNHQFLKNIKQDAQNLVASTEKAMEIPGLASDLIKNTLRGQTKINLDLEGSKPLMEDFNRIMNNLIVCIITAALLVASSLICTTNMQPQILGIPALGFGGYVLALGLGIYLIVKSNIKGK